MRPLPALQNFVCAVIGSGLLLLLSGCVSSPPSTPQADAPWRTLDLQALIDQTGDGGDLLIPYGRYRLAEGLVIKNRKHLTLTARTGTWIYVEDPDAHVISVLNSEDIEIRNLSLRHWEPLEEYVCHGSVVQVQDSNLIRIVNSVLDGCGAVGVNASNSRGISVHHCRIQNNSFTAFAFARVDGIELVSNVIENNANLLQGYEIHGLTMRENSIRDNFGYWARRSAQAPGPHAENPAAFVNDPDEGITAADRYRLRGEYTDLKEVVESRFVKGKTTREEVRRWLGKGGDNGAESGAQGDAGYVYPGVGHHRWVYFSSREEPYGSILLVDFDPQNRVSDFFWVSE